MTTGDDSGWINAGIQAAIAQGKTVYSVPAGTYTVDNPIFIPPGTRKFAFKGAGSGLTVFTTTNPSMKQAIQVGVLPQLHNNWMITGANNLLAKNVKQGACSVQLESPTPSLALGYYVLWDENKVVCAKGPNVSMNHAEVVKVLSYAPTTGVLKLDVPVGRDFGPYVKLCPYNAAVCTDIEVSGFGFLGSTSDGLAAVGIADRVVLRDLRVEGFRSDSIMTNTSRNVLIDNVHVSGASEGGAGSGYGVSIYRSRFVTVQNSSAQGCRHGFMMHSGTMDVTINNCTTNNGFDMHGYDERRIAILNCTGDGGDVGNDAWLAGARDVLIRNCKFTDPFGFHANVRNVRVVDTEMGGVGVYSAEEGTTPTVGDPAGGYADGIVFQRCTFKGSGYTLFWESGANRMGTIAFIGCTFENVSTSWGTIFDVGRVSGRITVIDSTLTVNSTDHIVQIANEGNGFSFVMRGCKLYGMGGLSSWVKATFAGQALMTDNCYYGVGYPPRFLADDSSRVVDIRNTVCDR
jgi:hypothetical protein